MECWRLLVDVANPKKGDQFPGFPLTIPMTANYGRKPAAHLPTLQVKGMTDPVVQVADEKGDVVYTLRIKGDRFRPMVFAPGRHTVTVGEPGTDRVRVLRDVQPAKSADEVVDVVLSPR